MLLTRVVLDQSQKRKVRIKQLRKELGELEQAQSKVERKGVEIERHLRNREVSEKCPDLIRAVQHY